MRSAGSGLRTISRIGDSNRPNGRNSTYHARRMDWPSVGSDFARENDLSQHHLFRPPELRQIRGPGFLALSLRIDGTFLRWLPGPQSGDFQVNRRTAPDGRHGRRVHVDRRDGIGGRSGLSGARRISNFSWRTARSLRAQLATPCLWWISPRPWTKSFSPKQAISNCSVRALWKV